MMVDIHATSRGSDENKPELVLSLNKLHLSASQSAIRHNHPVTPLNHSQSALTLCIDSNSSSSKSNSPDHVVPSEKNILSNHHRLSTSSGSSSPQTDGSISFRRTGIDPFGTDASRGSSVADSSASSPEFSPQNCRVLSTLPRKRSATNRRKPQRGKKRFGRKAIRIMQQSTDGNDVQQDEEESDEESVMQCICGYDDLFDGQIQCDSCKIWQHFGCMGVDPARVPDLYYCEKCDPAVPRPFCPQEARDYHYPLIPRNERDREKKDSGSKPRKSQMTSTVRRKKSVDNLAASVPPNFDLTSPLEKDREKKSQDSPSRQPSIETSAVKPPSREENGQLSRDAKKVLEYEKMFQRLEEKGIKKGKRKRRAQESSAGSPTRESTRERENMEDESHGDSTNPPESPPSNDVSAALPAINIVEAASSKEFVAPLEESPVRPPRRPKRFPVREQNGDKDRKTSSTSETENGSTPSTPVVEKPRFSQRLRNASSKGAEPNGTSDTGRIELNFKRKKDLELDMSLDEDSSMLITVTPPAKKRPRQVNFVDTYYSEAADCNSETNTQKAHRINRAYSASEKSEEAKVETERSRLCVMYGLKKAIKVRFQNELQAPSTSRSQHSSIMSEFGGGYPHGKRSEIVDPYLPFSRTYVPQSPFAVLKSSKTVRHMIDESVQRKHSVQTGQKFAKGRDVSPKKDEQRTIVIKPETKPSAPVIREVAAEAASKPVSVVEEPRPSTSVSSGFSTGSRPPSASFRLPQKIVLQRSCSEIVPRANAAEPGTGKIPDSRPASAVTGEPPLHPVASPTAPAFPQEGTSLPESPKKLSLAEYRQRKFGTPGSCDPVPGSINSHPSLAPVSLAIETNNSETIVSRAKSPTRASVPHPVTSDTLISSAPSEPAPVPMRSSVIQRAGSVVGLSTTQKSSIVLNRSISIDVSVRGKDGVIPNYPPALKPPSVVQQQQSREFAQKTSQSQAPPVFVQPHFRPAPTLASRGVAVDDLKSLNVA